MAHIAAPRRLFAPAFSTLWPSMLVPRVRADRFYPFNAPDARYFYFARNAVWHAVHALGLRGGEVLVPAYHHGVEVEALIHAGAVPVFYRVGRNWDIDLDDLERRISPRTKGLYLIHYAGFPGPTTEMKSMAERRGLALIEDCALSLFSSEGDRPLGSTGEAGIFCLHKTLPVPNGGVLTLNAAPEGRQHDYETPPLEAPPLTSPLSRTLSSLLQNLELRGGAPGRRVRRVIQRLGRGTVRTANIERIAPGTNQFNPDHLGLAMSDVSRRISLAQDVQRIVRIRRRNYAILLQRLRDVATPLIGGLTPGACPLFYPLIVDDKREIRRRLVVRGIEAIDLWRYFHPACDPSEFPDAAWLRDHVLEIPCHQDLTVRMIEGIARVVREVTPSNR